MYVLPVALAVFALIDLSRSTAEERAGLRPLWWVLVVLVPVLGPVVWILVSRSQRRGHAPRPSAPRAPDDDPDFLWRIEQEQRRRQRSSAPDDDEA